MTVENGNTYTIVAKQGYAVPGLGLGWDEDIDFSNTKNQAGDTIDLSAATFVISCDQPGVTFAQSFDTGTSVLTISLTDEQLTALPASLQFFRYFIAETTVLGAAWIARPIKIVRT